MLIDSFMQCYLRLFHSLCLVSLNTEENIVFFIIPIYVWDLGLTFVYKQIDDLIDIAFSLRKRMRS